MILDKFSTHIHLSYRESAQELLILLSKVWRGRLIHLSLNNGGEHNEEILKFAEKLFEVKTTFVEDMGNDQWGFINSFRDSEEETDNILYLHDKKNITWMVGACGPLLEKGCEAFNLMGEREIGLVGAHSVRQKILTYEKALEYHQPHRVADKNRGVWDIYESTAKRTIRSLKTLCWYQILVRELASAFQIGTHRNISDSFFPAGTIFMAKRQLVQVAHTCVLDDFFESGYVADGQVEHALERFYGYVCNSLNLRDVYI